MDTTNEIIARWAGVHVVTVSHDTGELLIKSDRPHVLVEWNPQTDIALWHGPGGLLEKIKERFLLARFCEALCGTMGCPLETEESDGSQWLQLEYACGLLLGEPPQLAAALVATIKEAKA